MSIMKQRIIQLCRIATYLCQPAEISRNVWKLPLGHMRTAKIQIRLRIRAVWSESSLCAFWIGKDRKFLYEDNEDWMRRLIWVFIGRAR